VALKATLGSFLEFMPPLKAWQKFESVSTVILYGRWYETALAPGSISWRPRYALTNPLIESHHAH
jgi:hypothetical protein